MGCPTEDLLERYLAGDATEADARTIDTHVEECERCRAWVTEAREDESLLGDLGHALDGETAGEPAGIDAAPAIPSALGRYRILGRLGEGGMGIVYEAEQQSPHRKVVNKALLDALQNGAHAEIHENWFGE